MKLTCSIFTLFNDFFNTFFVRIKISKDSSAKYYQKNKGRLQIKACERYQSLSEEQNTTVWLWTIQIFTRKWRTKACWV